MRISTSSRDRANNKTGGRLILLKRVGLVIGSVVLYALLWQLVALIVARPLLLPAPLEVLKRIAELLTLSTTWITALTTLARIVIGFAAGALIGIVLGVLSAKSSLCRWLFGPIRQIIKSTPVTSFILILIVLMASTAVPMVISGIMVIPMLWSAVQTGIDELDFGLSEVGKIYFKPFRAVVHIVIPQLMPTVLSTGATAWGFAWKSAIAAEILAFPINAIGRELYLSKLYVEMTDLFAWTVLAVLFSVITEQAIRLAVGRKL